MATVHTEYGPGKIVASETIRGCTRFKVAGEGFEVWLDETKLGAYERPDHVDFDAPHWQGHHPDDTTAYPEPPVPLSDDEYAEYADPRGHFDRDRMRTHPDYLDDGDMDSRFARRRQGRSLDEAINDDYDDPYGERFESEDLHGLRHRLHVDEYAEDDPARYSRRRQARGPEDYFGDIVHDDPYAEYGYDHDAEARGYGEHTDRYTPGAPGSYDDDPDSRYARKRTANPGLTGGDVWHDHANEDAYYDDDPHALAEYDELRELRRDRRQEHPDYYTDDDPAHYSSRGRTLGKGEAHLAWAPMDRDNSTELPYNPDPQHDAIGSPGDDNSSTLQPIHHIDADERTRSADSLSFEGEGDGDEPGPNPDLFAKQAFDLSVVMNHPEVRRKVLEVLPEDKRDVAERGWGGLQGHGVGAATGYGLNFAKGQIDNALDAAIGTGSGWGPLQASRHEATPAALGPVLRAVAPMLLSQAGDAASNAAGGLDNVGADLDGWGPLQASHRPAGLGDRYIDLTASADYHNDPVAQFRHDPDAYINRIGHLMDEGLNPRFAEYMDLVEADSGIRTAAWKDVRAKAMRLKTSGAVHVKDIAPSRIMASVDGDHGTYDVTILKGASYGDQSIANWHCGCEWGKWAFKRKFTYVGRLCSHAYASFLTMQSAALSGQPRGTRPSRGPADTVIVKRKQKDRFLPTFQMAAGRRTADALQNGPDRLTPELCVNDTDDAHMFMDVTKDERDDTGPDDVMSDQDIVHFARLMRHCEVTQQPYPRQLVAFLARYAGCADDATDDTQADYQAHDADDANEYLTELRNDADRDQEDDFGSMAERVRRIQDTVDEAREHGADASQFVAMVRTAADEGWETFQDGNRTVRRGPDNRGFVEDSQNPGVLTEVDFTNDGGENRQGPKNNRYVMTDDTYNVTNQNGNQVIRNENNWGAVTGPNTGGPRGVQFVGDGEEGGGGGDFYNYNGADDKNNTVLDYLRSTQKDGDSSAAQAPKKPDAPTQPNAPAKPASGQPPANTNGGAVTQQQVDSVGGNDGALGFGPGETNGQPAAASSAGAKYAPPGGGQTSGNVSDGGVAGAENSNNKAITKNDLDADGNYIMQQGDTLTDVAQRATGDMNKYQDIAKANSSITNVDDIAAGTPVNLKDFATDVGNNDVGGNVTNPKGGGSDNDIATAEPVNTDTAAGKAPAPAAPTGGDAATVNAVKPADVPAPPTAPAPTTATGKEGRRRRRWVAAPGHDHGSSDGSASSSTPTAETPGSGDRQAPGTNPASPTSSGTRTTTPGGADDFGPSIEETYDPTDPMQVSQQQNNFANPSAQAGSGSPQGRSDSLNMFTNPSGSDIGNLIGQGASVAGDIASSAMSALPGLSGVASGIGNAVSGIASGLGSIFSSKQDFDEWVRYAYPAGGGDDFDPDTLPHIPFAGSGNPGPLEFTTSEEYADKARAKMDDVTDLGDGDLTTPMGDWQKQAGRGQHEWWNDPSHPMYVHPRDRAESVDELVDEPSDFESHLRQSEQDRMRHPMRAAEDEDDPYHREASVGYSTDDDSDIVRRFQAHLGDSALGAGAGGGGGRFDDFSGAAQGFLRTAGRNYSMAEQSELIREGDKGGARNLDSLDLSGTHYEDMNTLGW